MKHLLPKLLLLGGLVCLPACRPEAARREIPLPSEVYVWQREWTPQVLESIGRSRTWLQAFHLLAAEVRFENATMKVTRIRTGKPALTGVKTGLVVRIFPSAAKTGWNAAAVDQIVGLARGLTAEWPAGSVAGIQLDYDCPESKLADYTRLLQAVKEEMAPLPVTCTALPSWLKQKDFPALAAVVPGYVLQVHSLHLPDRPGQQVSLVDLRETANAIELAVQAGVPFRVALPTYSCVVEFDAEGKVREVYAEDVPRALPLQSANYLVLDADAYGMADLVTKWRAEASPLLQAVVWYRLPVTADRLNWSLGVLEKVAGGQPMKRGWMAYGEPRKEGHSEIVIEQRGDAPDDLPPQVNLRWAGPEAAGFDGLGGYEVTESAAGYLSLKLANPGRMSRVAPGTRRIIGWLRIEGRSSADIFAEAIR